MQIKNLITLLKQADPESHIKVEQGARSFYIDDLTYNDNIKAFALSVKPYVETTIDNLALEFIALKGELAGMSENETAMTKLITDLKTEILEIRGMLDDAS